MDDLNEMLNRLMNDPQSMEQLKAAAKAMGLDPDGPPPPGFGGTAPNTQPPVPDLSALAAMLGGQSAPPPTPQAPVLDPAALQLMQTLLTRMNQPDKNIELLRALKPHFSAQRGARVDNAIRLLQLFSLLPLLKDSGLLGDLSGLLNGGRR